MVKRKAATLKSRGRQALASDSVALEEQMVVGIDPGFSHTGVALFGRSKGGPVVCRGLFHIASPPTPKKEMRNLRVSTDDYRRIRQIYLEIKAILDQYQPAVVAYEIYQPFTGKDTSTDTSTDTSKGPAKPKFRSASWKVARVEGVIVSLGLQADAMVLPYLPVDLKKGITGKRSASKVEIQDALCQQVEGFAEHLAPFAQTKKEHVADAAGYASLAFTELDALAAAIRLGR